MGQRTTAASRMAMVARRISRLEGIGPPGVTDHFVDSCENRKNGHGAGESEAEEAEAAMNVHAVRGDQ